MGAERGSKIVFFLVHALSFFLSFFLIVPLSFSSFIFLFSPSFLFFSVFVGNVIINMRVARLMGNWVLGWEWGWECGMGYMHRVYLREREGNGEWKGKLCTGTNSRYIYPPLS